MHRQMALSEQSLHSSHSSDVFQSSECILLIAKGLVKKLTCKNDRRLVDVIITDKGKKMLERLDEKQDEIDGVLGNLSEKDANILSDLLDKIRNSNE